MAYGPFATLAEYRQWMSMTCLGDDPMFFNNRDRIVGLAARYRLPDFHMAREFVDAGGLMSYGESMGSSYYKAASYVDKVVNGATVISISASPVCKYIACAPTRMKASRCLSRACRASSSTRRAAT